MSKRGEFLIVIFLVSLLNSSSPLAVAVVVVVVIENQLELAGTGYTYIYILKLWSSIQVQRKRSLQLLGAAAAADTCSYKAQKVDLAVVIVGWWWGLILRELSIRAISCDLDRSLRLASDRGRNFCWFSILFSIFHNKQKKVAFWGRASKGAEKQAITYFGLKILFLSFFSSIDFFSKWSANTTTAT